MGSFIDKKNSVWKTGFRAMNGEWKDVAGYPGYKVSSLDGYCKITPQRVLEVQRLYAEGFLQKEIGEFYGVCQQTISQVLT
jgi:DNA-binding NarL/FixJ family response regulator